MVLRRTPIIISRNEFVDIEMKNHIDDHSVGKKTQARKKRGANSRGLMLTEIADLQLTNHSLQVKLNRVKLNQQARKRQLNRATPHSLFSSHPFNNSRCGSIVNQIV